ncbi:MAG: thioredoxin-dependent thiol peroxidase [Leptospirillia bacterium]
MADMPKAGDPAPPFSLAASTGQTISLDDFRGKPVVLYFYPKDNTPGCTREACDFRDLKSEFDKAGAVVLGVSKDSLKSHENFVNKFELTFPLLADTETEVCQAYGVWAEKKNYGRTYMGIVRASFLIGPDGKVAKVWPKVKVDGHADAVLAAIGELG